MTSEQGQSSGTLTLSEKQSRLARYCNLAPKLTGCTIIGCECSYLGSDRLYHVRKEKHGTYAAILNLDVVSTGIHLRHNTAECFAIVERHNRNPHMKIEDVCDLPEYESTVEQMERELRKIA